MAVYSILVLMAALGIASVKSTCFTITCGSIGMPDQGPTRPLQPGPVTIETVDSDLCRSTTLYNVIVGFTAVVCLPISVPLLSCDNIDTVMVNKNGDYDGTIQFTAQCGLYADGSSKEIKKTKRYKSHYEPRYYDDVDGPHYHGHHYKVHGKSHY